MDTPARLLRLLALLTTRGSWQAGELAERLEITERTVRRDITRLRDLGYPVEAVTGPYGGYSLGAGGRLPPLLLDDEEAVAVAAALHDVAQRSRQRRRRPRPRRADQAVAGDARRRCASRSVRSPRSPSVCAAPGPAGRPPGRGGAHRAGPRLPAQ